MTRHGHVWPYYHSGVIFSIILHPLNHLEPLSYYGMIAECQCYLAVVVPQDGDVFGKSDGSTLDEFCPISDKSYARSRLEINAIVFASISGFDY